MKKVKKFLLITLAVLITAGAAIGVVGMTVNNHVVQKERSNILCAVNEDSKTPANDQIAALKKTDPDCILVLGCGIRDRETPTYMLRDRLDLAKMLYDAGVAPKILVSGDNGQVTHNEIHVMLNYLLEAGVPSEDIFCDHAGFSTYDSMYRADSIFQVKRPVVVTQSYHMYRAPACSPRYHLS